MTEGTRERIIAAGAEIIHRKGYNNTGIQEILAACGVPKGSFYHYFPSKEDFGVAVVEHHMACLGSAVSPILNDPARPPLERLEAFFRGREVQLAAANFERGCPIGNLAQELGDLSPRLRERLDQALGRMATNLGRVLAEARDRGELPPGLDPIEAAGFIVAAWEGALLQMKVEKRGEPLARCRRMIMERLLAR